MAIFKNKEKEENQNEYEGSPGVSQNTNEAMMDEPYNYSVNYVDEKKGGNKALLIILIVGVFVVFAGIIFALFRFGVLNLENFTASNLRSKIPIANNLVLPSGDETSVDKRDNTELLAEIDRLNSEIEKKDEEITRLGDLNNIYSEQVINLEQYRDNQENFNKTREDFESMVAKSDPKGFEKYYKEMSSENAERIYREIVGTNVASKDLKKYLSAFQTMDEKSIADIFTVMIDTELELVVDILKALPAEQVGGILAAMKPDDAAVITKRMYPEN